MSLQCPHCAKNGSSSSMDAETLAGREVEMIVMSKMGFNVIVTKREFETHLDYQRFTDKDRGKHLKLKRLL